MSVKISEQAFNTMLVEAVRKHPCLYNFKIPDYTRKDIIDDAWVQIGSEVNETVHTCKLRWKNIRTVFVRKMKSAKPGLTAKANKPYYLRNVLQFLVPFLKLSSFDAKDTIEQIKIENDEIEDHEDYECIDDKFYEGTMSNDDFSETESSQVEQNDANQADTEQNTETDIEKGDPIDIDSVQIANRGNKRKKDGLQEEEDAFFEFCNRPSHKIDDFDPNKMFLLSLLPDIQQMNHQQRRTFKRKALELVDDILKESPK